MSCQNSSTDSVQDMQKQAGVAIEEHEKLPTQEKPNDRMGIFETLLRSQSLPPSEKRRDRIAQEGFLNMSAGGETTSRVLTSALFYMLAGEPSMLSRLREELASIIKAPSSRPDWSSLEQLPYLVSAKPYCCQRILTTVQDGCYQGVSKAHTACVRQTSSASSQ